jgi:hypothetical protein
MFFSLVSPLYPLNFVAMACKPGDVEVQETQLPSLFKTIPNFL